MLHEAPSAHQQPGTRWKLRTLLAAVQSALRVGTLGGLWQLLRRLQVRWKRARAQVHSPDGHYREKLATIRTQVERVGGDRTRQVFLFGDEYSLYRHPRLAYAYERMGTDQPLARLGWSKNKLWRYAAALNVYTGQVVFVEGSQISIPKLVTFFQQLVRAFPEARQLWLAEDNWPLHFHPDVLVALQPQHFPFGIPKPHNWPDQPRAKAQPLNLPIHLLGLPTYASWTNPIEKLWRLLNQEVLALHPFEDNWDDLRLAVRQFLWQFATDSPYLLRYVGLANPDKLYQALFLPNLPNGGI